MPTEELMSMQCRLSHIPVCLAAWGLGACLIVSAASRPEYAWQLIGYLADLFNGDAWVAMPALLWLLTATAGLGLLVLRPMACYALYAAYLYSLLPFGRELLLFPITLVVSDWFHSPDASDTWTADALNGLFVAAALAVHVVLSKRTIPRPTTPRADHRVLIVNSAVLLLLQIAGITIITDWGQRFIRLLGLPHPTKLYLILLGVPIFLCAIRGLTVAIVRIRRRGRAHHVSLPTADGEAFNPLPDGIVAGNAASSYRFSLGFLFWCIACVSCPLAIATAIWRNAHDPNRYYARFAASIRFADRIVVRDGGFNCCASVDEDRILFEVTDEAELREVQHKLELEPGRPDSQCMCCGYPGIDWYRGGRRLALTSMHHDEAIRWIGFPGDVALTPSARAWLIGWLKRHGVTTEVEPIPVRVTREARQLLGEQVSADFALALAEPKTNDTSSNYTQRTEAKYLRIRAAFTAEQELYATLFRTLGCLTMRWDAWYEPEQGVAFDFLTRAPGEELDRAVQRAALSQDAHERRGAARIIFSQYFMLNYGKSRQQITNWMTSLAMVAFSDPVPANRRLVVRRMAEYGIVDFQLLELAARDPDATVRRAAMETLASDGSSSSVAILAQIVKGEVTPSAHTDDFVDYTEGATEQLHIPEMAESDDARSDRQIAQESLRAIYLRRTQ
jgi:hypothetical protein